MATTKGPNGTVAADDLLDFLEDDAPEPRKGSVKTPANFVPDDRLTERLTASFGRTGAVTLTRVYPTAKDARKDTIIYTAHAEIAATTFEGKTVSTKVLEITPEFASEHEWAKDAVGQFRVKFQLTHKRIAKDAAKTPAETPAETPAT